MIARQSGETAASKIAAAIGEPARARMLYSLMDGHARTSTELAVVAEVSPSTASVHLGRLKQERLVIEQIQGKHHYYGLAGLDVAKVLEGLNVLAGRGDKEFQPRTPSRLRAARTCYDHLAGTVGVQLHDRMHALGWFRTHAAGSESDYELTAAGGRAMESLRIDIEALHALRRRFAYACLDWSERRPHLGGSLAAALLKAALTRRWVSRELDSRAIEVTRIGQRELSVRFGIEF
jgi:DNA-binding transcriptional ArsR family regulator